MVKLENQLFGTSRINYFSALGAESGGKAGAVGTTTTGSATFSFGLALSLGGLRPDATGLGTSETSGLGTLLWITTVG